MKKDILITKEKNKISQVIPQTAKAKKIFKNHAEGNESGFEIYSSDASKILSFALSHGLTIDSKVELKIKAKA